MEKFDDAAIRHYVDAKYLREADRLDNAGHLIGFAVECAIKYCISTLKSPPKKPSVHLPKLLPIARIHLGPRGINNAKIYNALRTDILSGWLVENRYFSNGHTKKDDLDLWIKQTGYLFSAAGIKVKP